MTPTETERIIEEVEHSLAVEGMTMTDKEKENPRKVSRGELTYSELINQYAAEAKQVAAVKNSLLEDAIDALELQQALDEDSGERISWASINEERISKRNALELFDTGEIDKGEPGSFSSLAHIHEKLFDDIYDFAGKMRTEDISKGAFRFASVLYLDESVSKVEAMPQSLLDEIIEKYVEMNIAHPFRDGNGRSMRLWLDQMFKAELKLIVDWAAIDKDAFLHAMENSPINDAEIKRLLKDALTDIDDRDIYMKGIDASFAFEGYNTFKTEELD